MFSLLVCLQENGVPYNAFFEEYIRMCLFLVTRDVEKSFAHIDTNHDNVRNVETLLRTSSAVIIIFV